MHFINGDIEYKCSIYTDLTAAPRGVCWKKWQCIVCMDKTCYLMVTSELRPYCLHCAVIINQFHTRSFTSVMWTCPFFSISGNVVLRKRSLPLEFREKVIHVMWRLTNTGNHNGHRTHNQYICVFNISLHQSIEVSSIKQFWAVSCALSTPYGYHSTQYSP